MSLKIQSIGTVLIFLSLGAALIGCSPLKDKSASNQFSGGVGFDEKPEILDISTSVIWGGEPTLGGNWVSHPKIKTPERVIIKNMSNGKSVVGAVFQQTLQIDSSVISSDAAQALEIEINDKTKVQVVAVRSASSTEEKISGDTEPSKINQSIEENLSRPYIQVGIFGVKNNATRTENKMTELDLPVNIFDFVIKDKTYWRVVVGPASALDHRTRMLKSIKSAGFTDAYFVSN